MNLQPILLPLIRLSLGFYFSRIERFAPERIPARGPLLIVANHPSSVVDAFVLGTVTGRRLHFVGTIQLFRSAALAWLLRHVGIIAVNRYSDDSRAMRSVLATFERCYEVLEAGGAVGIFPEGISHSDPCLKKIKTGAARMALELEHRHGGNLGLQVLPVGLNFSRRSSYRSSVLVHFGQPLQPSAWLSDYATRRRESIRSFNARIEESIQQLIVHIPDLEQARLVESIKTLYLERGAEAVRSREISSGTMRRLIATQAFGDAIERFKEQEPARFFRFARNMRSYQRRRRRLQLSEEALRSLSIHGLTASTLGRALLAVVALPAAAYGWLHRLIPLSLVRWSIRNLTERGKKESQTATTAILTGAIAFLLFYGLFASFVHSLWGWPVSLWYFISLPITGLIAEGYARQFRRLREDVRVSLFWLRNPLYARRLLVFRRRLLRDLDAFRDDYLDFLERSDL